MTNEELVRSNFRRQVGREPTPYELRELIAEAVRRGESQAQWQARVDRGEVRVPRSPPPPETTTQIDAQGRVHAVPWNLPEQLDYVANTPPPTGREADSDPLAEMRLQVGQRIEDELRYVPGAPPWVGIIKDGTPIDLRTGLPAKDLDPVDVGFARLAHEHYAQLPRYTEYKQSLPPFGRLEYGGDPSEEELELRRRFVAGDRSAAGPLAKARGARLRMRPRPGIDAIMRPLTLALTSLAFSALGGGAAAGLGAGPALAGAIGGAAGGGITSAVASHGDLEQTLLGFGTGAAGGAGAEAQECLLQVAV